MDAKPQSKRIALDIREWEQTFQELICQEKPRARWTLKMDGSLRPDSVAQGWKQYQQKGFGRFSCSSCRRSWASAQVKILCHMYLENQKSPGKVLMRIFGQRCKKCSRSQFEKPDFSPESRNRILQNLVQRVLEKFYRNDFRKVSELPVIPEVPLNGSHDTANCEACVLGYCILNSENGMTGPERSSVSYMEIGSSSPHNGDQCGQNRSRNHLAVGSRYSGAHIGSGPSHVTAGIQVPGKGPQPKREMGQLFTPGADRQAARATGPQPIRVAGSLPPGWTDPRPIQAVGPLPTGRAHSQSTQGRGPQAPRMTYSQAIRRSGQQSTHEAQATEGAQLQATKVTEPQPTRATIPRTTSGSDSQAKGMAGPPPQRSSSRPTQEAIPKATSGSDSQAKGMAGPPPQRSSSQPTRATIPRATSGSDSQAKGMTGPPPQRSSSRPTQEAIPKATSESDSQAKGMAGPPPQRSSSQPTREAIPKVTIGSDSQAKGMAGPPPQRSSSQPTREAIPKATVGSDSQAKGMAGPPPQRSSSQPAQETIPKATSGSDTKATRRAGLPLGSSSQSTWPHVGPSCGSQAAWGREERYSPGGSVSDSFFRLPPSNDLRNQEQLFRWGYVCIFALFTFLVSKYL
ncbi:receptor-transporting protein 4 isoform X1 [Cervus elaphus]|uniref:receptor-transporting protein 4 isoform X1 n=1 Tax=Cervus elaphus TaxID=9860 RepID=UPI001CC2AA7F|nr:receptor-transporting protein 4 isoform X1 [Cervus elaphus]